MVGISLSSNTVPVFNSFSKNSLYKNSLVKYVLWRAHIILDVYDFTEAFTKF